VQSRINRKKKGGTPLPFQKRTNNGKKIRKEARRKKEPKGDPCAQKKDLGRRLKGEELIL